MANYCEICGDELTPEEEEEGICQKCKKSVDEEYESDEEFNDPAVT